MHSLSTRDLFIMTSSPSRSTSSVRLGTQTRMTPDTTSKCSKFEIVKFFLCFRYMILSLVDISMACSTHKVLEQKKNTLNFTNEIETCSGFIWRLTRELFDSVCSTDSVSKISMFQLDPTNNTDYNGNPYPFGMDPVSTILAREKMWPSNCNFAKVRKLHSKM